MVFDSRQTLLDSWQVKLLHGISMHAITLMLEAKSCASFGAFVEFRVTLTSDEALMLMLILPSLLTIVYSVTLYFSLHV